LKISNVKKNAVALVVLALVELLPSKPSGHCE
jgi:hypothetical protein